MCKKIKHFFIFLLLLTNTFNIKSQTTENYLEKVSEWGNYVYMKIFMTDNYAFLPAGPGGIDVFDISNLPEVQKVNSQLFFLDENNPNTIYSCFELENFQNYLIGIFGIEGGSNSVLAVIDTSNPLELKVVSKFQCGSKLYKIGTNGDFVIGYDTNKVRIYDFRNFGNPVSATSIQVSDNSLVGMAVSGSTAYVFDNDHNCYVIDFSEPYAPKIVTSFFANYPSVEKIFGDLLVFASGNDVFLYDISNPNSPTQYKTYVLEGTSISDLWLEKDKKMYVFYDDSSNVNFRVYDISGSQPKLLGDNYSPVRFYAAGVKDPFVFALGYDGIKIFQVSDTGTPTLMSTANNSGQPTDIFVLGKKMYVAAGNGGLKIVDISDIENPKLISEETSMINATRSITVNGLYAFTTSLMGDIWSYNIVNPNEPYQEGFYDSWGQAFDLYCFDNDLYLADGTGGLHVIDISDPTNMKRKCSFYSDGIVQSFAFEGNDKIFSVGDSEGISVFSMDNLCDFRIENSFPGYRFENMYANFRDKRVYCSEYNKLYSLTYDENFNFTLIDKAYSQTGNYRDLTAFTSDTGQEDYIVASTEHGIEVYKYDENTNSLELLESHPIPNYGFNIKKYKNYVFVTCSNAGKVYIYKVNFPLGEKPYEKMRLPHVTWTDYWQTYLILDNLSNQDSSVNVNIYDSQGNYETKTFNIEALKSTKIPLENGEWATIDNIYDVLVKESFVSVQEEGIAEFPIIPGREADSYLVFLLPEYNKSYLTWMGLALTNMSDNLNLVSMKAYDESGNLIDFDSINLKPFEKTIGILDSFFKNIDYMNISKIIVESEFPVSGLTISGNGNKQLLFTPAFQGNENNTEFFIPHIADSWEYWTNLLILDNLSFNETHAELILYDKEGNEHIFDFDIPSMETKIIYLNDYSSFDPQCGKIIVNSSEVAVRQSFRANNQGGTAEFILSNKTYKNFVLSFPSYASDILTWYGFAIFNTEDFDVSTKLTAYSDGEVINTVTLTIPKHSRLVDVVENIFTIPEGKTIDRVVVSSTGNLVGLNISGSEWERLLFSKGFPLE